MNKTNTSTKYTYADFARDVIASLNGEIEMTPAKAQAMRNKAVDLLNAQVKKAEYNANHKSAKAPKGASPETRAKADAIAKVLTAEPMTAAEISKAVGTDYTALQVANAVKYIEGVTSVKVVRATVNAKGLRSEREYTAYCIG